jgi:hypothetical protein
MKKVFMLLLVALVCAFSVNAATITISSDITTSTTWTNNNVYVLTGGFRYVTNNSTLTIQAGTIVKGVASSLVITRGSKIMAVGTPTMPIIFTSNQPAGSRLAADWGGVLILGRAPINDPAGSRIAEGGIDPTLGLYGGTDPNDNSGVMQYCRIEYAGIAYQPNNETNGLTMGGVGAGTTIDHIQVSHGGDDSFEWFGGNVSAKYLVAYRGLDDDFDTDYGFSGKLQFGVGIRDSAVADVSGSNGFESDNDATGSTNAPNTNATISNFTLFGPRRVLTTPVNSNYRRAAHLRRNTKQDIYNTVFTGWVNGLKIENTLTGNNVASGDLQFKNNVLAGIGSLVLDSAGLPAYNYLNWFNSNSNSTLANPMDVMAGNPYNYTAPTFIPSAGSPILTGADFSSANVQDPFFTPVSYKGAFGATDWTACWTEFNPNAQSYTTVPVSYMTAPTISFTGTTTFCNGGTRTLTASSGYTSYSWSNGATTQSITVSTTGNYTVTATNTRGCALTSDPVVITVTPGPAANVSVSGATTFCTGGAALLAGSSSLGASYQWYNNNVIISGATTPYYTATASGSYSLRTTLKGCTGNSNTTTVTVNANPTATIAGTLTVCNGGSTTLTAPTGTGLTYQWNQGGSAIPGATASTYNAMTGGSYTVEVYNSNGCSATSVAATVVATTLSVATTATNSGIICGTSPVTLTATTVTGATYEWYRNGQIIAGATGTTYAANTSGAHYAKITKTGCSAFSNSISVGTQTLPTLTASATTVCSGVGVVLTASSGNSYTWYNNGVAISGGTNQVYSTITSGSYSVKVNSCTSIPTVVTVNPLPTAAITAAGPVAFCLGNSVLLNATTGTGLAYEWKRSNSVIAGATVAAYTANISGSYTVKVTNSTTGCYKTSSAVTVTANAIPVTPTVTYNSTTKTLTSNATTGNQWYNGATAISGATATTYVIPAATSGCFSTLVTNTTGCTAQSDTLCRSVSTPPTFGYNGNGIETAEGTSFMNVSVVPNPNNGIFELNIQNNLMDTQAQLTIVNLMGQVVYSENMGLNAGESTKAIRLENAASGVYFVRLQAENKTFEYKIVINN